MSSLLYSPHKKALRLKKIELLFRLVNTRLSMALWNDWHFVHLGSRAAALISFYQCFQKDDPPEDLGLGKRNT
jgi:hypothetical protein